MGTQGPPLPCWGGKPYSFCEALILPSAKDPSSEVTNFEQVPEILIWPTQRQGRL